MCIRDRLPPEVFGVEGPGDDQLTVRLVGAVHGGVQHGTIDRGAGFGQSIGVEWKARHLRGTKTPVLCVDTVSYTHLRAHETVLDLVCRLLLEKKKIRHNEYISYLI
eukprot:TRINITY_DN12980_c0_g1_i1.p1 TRINITY_DN12980_c0_g1~~TRINITY_DN12980_c0_g1_i1.p1  ORF type:complete len:107 (+),score=39.82 TRINITY_DN12980_c0_g1_i1:116-436(+)